MTTNGGVTIYHYDEESGTYSVVSFEKASVYQKTHAVPAENGVKYDNICTVRIPASQGIVVDVGDYVFVGITDENQPDKSKCRKVVGFSDNRRGINPHWRIDCK